MNKRGLGRGLDALITPVADTESESAGVISLSEIVPNQFQPRRVFDEDTLHELAQSIRQYGVLQPIVVRRIMNGYELVAGERRWRAAKLAGLSDIPAVVKEYSDAEMTEIALVENLQREDLNPIEESVAYRRLMEEFGLTQEEVARRIGRSRSLIANVLRLLHLPAEIQEHVSRGTLSIGQARPLIGLDNEETQIEIANTIIREQLTARDVEELVRRALRNPRPRTVKKAEKREIFVAEAEERLRMILGTQVKIKPGKVKSRIEIEFYSADDLERIIEALMPSQQEAAATRTRSSLVV